MKRPTWLVLVLVGALAGLVFAGISTYDFVQHLDRQVHSLHCSFLPGAGAETGASGCQAAMMSPYSSVFRTSVWGGIPISLAAMSVFAFLLFYGADLLLTRRKDDPRATGFLALATALPAAMSLLMLTISLIKLGTTCKLCVGVYIASAMCAIGAVTLWRQAVAKHATLPEAVATSKSGDSKLTLAAVAPRAPTSFFLSMFGLGVAFVALPVCLYLALAPDHGRFIGTCGVLENTDDTYGVMVPLHRGGDAAALEIFDPLCPACKAFEARLDSSGFADRLDRKAILFPLDTTCNWMITENTHPGACTISEAVLCAGERAPEVIRWAFGEAERIRAETKTDAGAAARIVGQRFPDLASCVGSAEARSRLNKSLRWSVANNIRVLTPQLFVNNVKLCDEDVDIGLDYALSRMISMPAPPRTTPPPVAAPPGGTVAAPLPPTAPHASGSGDPALAAPAAPTGTSTTDPMPAETPTKPAEAPASPGSGARSTSGGSAQSSDKPIEKPTEATDKPADKPVEPPANRPAEVQPPPADKPAAPAPPADTTGGAQ
jgi:uncharacterized membrane protein